MQRVKDHTRSKHCDLYTSKQMNNMEQLSSGPQRLSRTFEKKKSDIWDSIFPSPGYRVPKPGTRHSMFETGRCICKWLNWDLLFPIVIRKSDV
jgi:hypothetical protein